MYSWTKSFSGLSRWLCLLVVGMVGCVNRCVCVCLLFPRLFRLFQSWRALLSGLCVCVLISRIPYSCDVRCFAVFILLPKKFPTGTIKLYSIVLYWVKFPAFCLFVFCCCCCCCFFFFGGLLLKEDPLWKYCGVHIHIQTPSPSHSFYLHP